MRRHIPKEYKEIAIHMSLNEGVSDKLIHCHTGISQRAMKPLWKTYRETGEVVRTPVDVGRPRRIDSLDAAFLEGCIERQPDISLSKLQDHLREVCNVIASTDTISRTLYRRGFTRKKVTRPAIEHDEADHAAYKMLRPWAWSPRRNRARRRDFFIRGHRYSILPALSLDGILHLEVLDHSFTGDDFADFIEGVLDQMQPWPLPNSVLVMDNASIHKVPGIREMVEERGMRILYLPSYSPDLNPIEEAFSAIKAWLWANRDYVLRETEGYDCDPYALIWEAVYGVVTPDKIYGWYQHSEYIA